MADNPSNNQEITPGIKFEWWPGKDIYIWSIHTASQQAADAWFSKVDDLIAQHDPQQPARMIFIMSEYITVTAYIRHRALEFATQHQTDFYGRIAFVIVKSPLRGLIQIFAKREMAGRFKFVNFDVFYDFDNALTWVSEPIPYPDEEA